MRRRVDIRSAIKATRGGFPLLKRLKADVDKELADSSKYALGKNNPVWRENFELTNGLYLMHKSVCDEAVARVDQACEPWFKL